MSQNHDIWGWMLAVDIFLAGMGSGMLVIIGVLDLFVGEGRTSLLANVLAPIFIGMGAAMLILELGRPFQALRVFMNPKAILTVGAWFMSFAITFGLIYASFGFDFLYWSQWALIRKLFAILCVLSGLVVATYPGVLLARHKGRPFWHGPGMMVLFLLSSFATGIGAHILCGMVIAPATLTDVLAVFPPIGAALLFFQLPFWLGYVAIKRSGGHKAEAVAVQRWIKGDFSFWFQGGFLLIGTLIPLILLLSSSVMLQAAGAACTLLGGLIMRLLVIYGGKDRTWLPGEERYRSRLPHGNEAFMKAWNK